MIQDLNRRFHAPTPPKLRKLGKSINLLGTMIQVAVGGMQVSGGDSAIMTPKQYFWFVIGLAILQWLGTTITDFFTEDTQLQQDGTTTEQI